MSTGSSRGALAVAATQGECEILEIDFSLILQPVAFTRGLLFINYFVRLFLLLF
jgi:hypothetical protein